MPRERCIYEQFYDMIGAMSGRHLWASETSIVVYGRVRGRKLGEILIASFPENWLCVCAQQQPAAQAERERDRQSDE